MSLRIDSTEWISGSLIIGSHGLGVLAETIPSTGDSGAGYLYNDLSLPTDNGKEIAGRIVSAPASGVLYAYEDGSFIFSGAADGIYYFDYQLYVDGVATGSPSTVTLLVGQLTLNPPLFSNTNSFFVPTVTRGAVVLNPAVFLNTNNFFAPSVSLAGFTQNLNAPLLVNNNTFFGVILINGSFSISLRTYISIDRTLTYVIPSKDHVFTSVSRDSILTSLSRTNQFVSISRNNTFISPERTT